MSYLVKSGADFVNCLRCPECFAQIMAIEPVERENFDPLGHNRYEVRPRLLGYDLLPCMCFLPSEAFTLVWRQTEQGPTIEFDMSSYPKRDTFNKGWCSGSDYDLIPEVTASRGGIRFPTEEEMLKNEKKAKAATREHPHHFGPEREICFICKEARRLEDEKHIEQLRSEHDGHQEYVEECPTCEEEREHGCPCCEKSY